jgi:sucrose-6-phosphate hydrolase SacC (GH32 family)
LQVLGDEIPLYLTHEETTIDARVVFDRSIVEVFVQGGCVAHTSRVYDSSVDKGPTTVIATVPTGSSGSVNLEEMAVFELGKPRADPGLEHLAKQAWQAN